MTGLEKVTGKILADAEADAQEISAGADAKCAELTEKYDRELAASLEVLREKADRECRAVITRAKSSAEMAKRNELLEARSRILNEAYAAAEKNIKHLPADDYFDMLYKMLRGAMRREIESEEDSLKLYGEDTKPEAYELLLNAHDRDEYGKALLAQYREAMQGKVDEDRLGRMKLSTDIAAINGGLILRCGPVESNCSLSMIFEEARRATEGKISHILFDREEPAD